MNCIRVSRVFHIFKLPLQVFHLMGMEWGGGGLVAELPQCLRGCARPDGTAVKAFLISFRLFVTRAAS